MKTPAKQLARVRDWERRNPERSQARKNAWAKTAKGKAAAKRRQRAHNQYRKRWRAEQRKKAKAGNSPAQPPGCPKL